MPRREVHEGYIQRVVGGSGWQRGVDGGQQVRGGRLCSHTRRECWQVASVDNLTWMVEHAVVSLCVLLQRRQERLDT